MLDFSVSKFKAGIKEQCEMGDIANSLSSFMCLSSILNCILKKLGLKYDG